MLKRYSRAPMTPTSFFLLDFGRMDLSCRFTGDRAGKVTALAMEGGGLSLVATRVE
jgi:hypothetical protein